MLLSLSTVLNQLIFFIALQCKHAALLKKSSLTGSRINICSRGHHK